MQTSTLVQAFLIATATFAFLAQATDPKYTNDLTKEIAEKLVVTSATWIKARGPMFHFGVKLGVEQHADHPKIEAVVAHLNDPATAASYSPIMDPKGKRAWEGSGSYVVAAVKPDKMRKNLKVSDFATAVPGGTYSEQNTCIDFSFKMMRYAAQQEAKRFIESDAYKTDKLVDNVYLDFTLKQESTEWGQIKKYQKDRQCPKEDSKPASPTKGAATTTTTTTTTGTHCCKPDPMDPKAPEE